ncbi:hypothetical protein F5884DRAFT_666780 [Xylogone sp. PMI_703]|nr:hypothetical protein F5884DRAFT_666780 [Xylogone sp. PMI_703]
MRISRISSAALLLLANCVYTSSIDNQQPLTGDASSTESLKGSLSLIDLHKALVEYESITGNEHGVAKFLTEYLEGLNFTVEAQEISGSAPASEYVPDENQKLRSRSRENIFAYVGSSRKTRTLVTSHIDTVPPFWPYERRGDEIWGRGTVDAKGSVAAQIKAVEELLAGGAIAEGDVALLFVVGEETGGDGMRKANHLGLKWDTVIFGEPTELKLASGHKGILSLKIHAKGKAGHSGYPELGRNANSMLIPVLYAVLNAELPWSEKYGNTTLNLGRVEGGVAANVIAEEAFADIALRIAAGTPASVKKILSDAIEKTGQEVDVEFGYGYGPVYIDSDVEGFDTIVVNYGTDIPNLEGDHKRYLYGPGDILVAHSDHEHLKVSDLETAVKGYKTLIEHSLK